MCKLQTRKTSRKQVRVTNTPYTPLLYSITGVYRGVHFLFIFFFLLQNIDFGYSLEPPHSLRRFSHVPTIYVLSKNKKNIKNFHLKIIIFTAVKYCHVCVMIKEATV